MGSFRIVTGSGNSRREYSSGVNYREAINNLKIKAAAIESKSRRRKSSIKVTKPSPNKAKSAAQAILNTIMDDMYSKAKTWAEQTMIEFRDSVPVDTGNLRDSIVVLGINKNYGSLSVSASVGVDEALILPPPTYKYSTVRKSKKKMPNRDYSPYVLGSSGPYSGTAWGVADTIGRGKAHNTPGNKISTSYRVSKAKFDEIAKKNVKKILP